MKGNKEKAIQLLPYSRATILTTLAFAYASGGFGGYYVSKTAPSPRILSEEFETQLHIVERIIDGDTFAIEGGARIRMLGINAPETDSCGAEEATTALRELLLGQQVMLQKDSAAMDARGRLLRYVFLYNADAQKDNVFVNEYMVRSGYAISQHVGADRRYMRLLNNSMGLAENERAGWHSMCTDASDELEPYNESCVIKGNNDQGVTNDRYYVPECQFYNRIKMRWTDGDEYFCSTDQAEQAGFRLADNCPVE